MTMPVEMSWGPENEIIELTTEMLLDGSCEKIIGYTAADKETLVFRQALSNCRRSFIYKLNNIGGEKSYYEVYNDIHEFLYRVEAKYKGICGDNISFKVIENPLDNTLADLVVYYRAMEKDRQKISRLKSIRKMLADGELKNNEWINIIPKIDQPSTNFGNGFFDIHVEAASKYFIGEEGNNLRVGFEVDANEAGKWYAMMTIYDDQMVLERVNFPLDVELTPQTYPQTKYVRIKPTTNGIIKSGKSIKIATKRFSKVVDPRIQLEAGATLLNGKDGVSYKSVPAKGRWGGLKAEAIVSGEEGNKYAFSIQDDSEEGELGWETNDDYPFSIYCLPLEFKNSPEVKTGIAHLKIRPKGTESTFMFGQIGPAELIQYCHPTVYEKQWKLGKVAINEARDVINVEITSSYINDSDPKFDGDNVQVTINGRDPYIAVIETKPDGTTVNHPMTITTLIAQKTKLDVDNLTFKETATIIEPTSSPILKTARIEIASAFIFNVLKQAEVENINNWKIQSLQGLAGNLKISKIELKDAKTLEMTFSSVSGIKLNDIFYAVIKPGTTMVLSPLKEELYVGDEIKIPILRCVSEETLQFSDCKKEYHETTDPITERVQVSISSSHYFNEECSELTKITTWKIASSGSNWSIDNITKRDSRTLLFDVHSTDGIKELEIVELELPKEYDAFRTVSGKVYERTNPTIIKIAEGVAPYPVEEVLFENTTKEVEETSLEVVEEVQIKISSAHQFNPDVELVLKVESSLGREWRIKSTEKVDKKTIKAVVESLKGIKGNEKITISIPKDIKAFIKETGELIRRANDSKIEVIKGTFIQPPEIINFEETEVEKKETYTEFVHNAVIKINDEHKFNINCVELLDKNNWKIFSSVEVAVDEVLGVKLIDDKTIQVEVKCSSGLKVNEKVAVMFPKEYKAFLNNNLKPITNLNENIFVILKGIEIIPPIDEPEFQAECQYFEINTPQSSFEVDVRLYEPQSRLIFNDLALQNESWHLISRLGQEYVINTIEQIDNLRIRIKYSYAGETPIKKLDVVYLTNVNKAIVFDIIESKAIEHQEILEVLKTYEKPIVEEPKYKIVINDMISNGKTVAVIRKIDKKKPIEELVSAGILNNNYILFSGTGLLQKTLEAIRLSGGTSRADLYTAEGGYFSLIKGERWNCMALPQENITPRIKAIAVQLIKDLREEQGIKCQLVLDNYAGSNCNYEGVISTKQGYKTSDEEINNFIFTAYVAGLTAGTQFNKSNTFKVVDGAIDIIYYNDEKPYSNAEYEKNLKQGFFLLSKRRDLSIVCEKDQNTLHEPYQKQTVNYSFTKNRVIRTLDEINNTIVDIWESRFVGKVSNNDKGRTLYKTSLINYMRELERLEAIQNFNPQNDVSVEQGEKLDSVVVNLAVQPVDAMEKLYMTINIQ